MGQAFGQLLAVRRNGTEFCGSRGRFGLRVAALLHRGLVACGQHLQDVGSLLERLREPVDQRLQRLGGLRQSGRRQVLRAAQHHAVELFDQVSGLPHQDLGGLPAAHAAAQSVAVDFQAAMPPFFPVPPALRRTVFQELSDPRQVRPWRDIQCDHPESLDTFACRAELVEDLQDALPGCG
ncbi:hypothetical protein ACF06X_14925 [Streptomyces sp. NPDC015346]|uniref:hypothetical protein n=1 Tax=Streptomyces sp. NPDC015346 TaxID=3364954 RepID=UPI003701D462